MQSFQYRALLFSVVTFVFFGCHKTNQAYSNKSNGGDILTAIESISTNSKSKTDGIFFFESNVANNDPGAGISTTMGGLFYNQDGNIQSGGGVLLVGNKKIIPDSMGNYAADTVFASSDFYGKEIAFSLTPPLSNTNGAGITLTDSLYSPAAIYITNVAPLASLTVNSGSAIPLTWNKDPNNHNGIVVMAQYLPGLYANLPASNNGYNTALSNTITLPDNGSAVLPAGFLSGFPVNAQLQLWVARGNFKIVSYGKYSYTIGGYCASAIWNMTLQ